MIKINSKSLVFVLCPAGLQTGGTELCHQLVDYLNNKGLVAYMVYISKDYEIIKAEVPGGFQRYNIKVTSELINLEDNIVVFPETLMHMLKALNCENMNYIFWWMSLDNYFHISSLRDYLKFKQKNIRGLASKIKNLIAKRFNPLTFNDLQALGGQSVNVYQSSYVNHFLLDREIYNQLPLSDYINLDFINEKPSDIAKENIILYNPTKGFDVTKKIMDKMGDYNFVPLENLSRSQLHDLMSRAKLYIDFGYHPGKDRIPREAVINNCCIIVGKNGSAKYFQDVPILGSYKIDNQDIDIICERITFVLNNYEACHEDFNLMKVNILKEKRIFEEEIDNIFFNQLDK